MFSRQLKVTFLTQNSIRFSSTLMLKDKSTAEIVRSLAVLRLSSFGSFVKNAEKLHNLSEKIIGKRLTEALVKRTFYEQFIAGCDESSLQAECSKLLKGNILAMVCPPMEDLSDSHTSSNKRSANAAKFKQLLQLTQRLNDSHSAQKAVMQVKLTGIFSSSAMDAISFKLKQDQISLAESTDLVEKVMLNGVSNDNLFSKDLCVSLGYLHDILQEAERLKMPIMIDAELKSAHEIMFAIGQATTQIFNKQFPLVHNTYQCYAKGTSDYLTKMLQLSASKNVWFGAKIVRGAYMDAERTLARIRGYADPIWESCQLTSDSYNRAVAQVLTAISNAQNQISLYIAGHNSESIKLAKERMQLLNIPAHSESVKFAQIYGMCDHISYELAAQGYTVYKSIPFGSLDEWQAYMIRRASENHTAFKTTRNEIPIYRQELLRRLKLRKG